MPNLLMTSIEYSSYISIIKFVIFLFLFFLWLPLLGWVHKDAESIGTKKTFWAAVVFGTGAAAAIIWLVMPLFIIGMLVYLIAVAAAQRLICQQGEKTRFPQKSSFYNGQQQRSSRA